MTDTNSRSRVQDLREVLAAGGNLMEHMRRARQADDNDEVTILHSYDLQAGTYVASLSDPAMAELKRKVGKKLAEVFAALGATVLCEAGVGEATTLAEVVSHASGVEQVLGFDISLSRLLHARRHLASRGAKDVRLFTGALASIPVPDDAIDVVYTFHSIEPNGGREREVLTELLRVTEHYLVLVEPSNELGSAATQARIEKFRYVKNVHATLLEMGCRVARFERWGLDAIPENEAALIVVEKRPRRPGPGRVRAAAPRLASPFSKLPLNSRSDCLYSPEDGMAFPIIDGIPCLLRSNAIIATQLDAFDGP